MRIVERVSPNNEIHRLLLPRPLRIKLGVPMPRGRVQGQPTLTRLHHHHQEAQFMTQLQDSQALPLTLSITDSMGNQTSPGALSWSVSDESVATLVDDPNDDNTKYLLPSGDAGHLGTVTVTVSDDEDGDPSTAEFLGSLAVDVVSGPVAAITVNAGTAVDRSEAPGGSPTPAPAPDPAPEPAPAPAPDPQPAPAPTPDPQPAPDPVPDPAPEPPAPVDPPTPAPDNPPTPAPDNPPAPEPVQAPQPVYTYSGTDPVDTSTWPQAPFTGSDGQPLFYFSGDSLGGAPTGDGQGGFSVYSGDLQLAADPAQPDAPGA